VGYGACIVAFDEKPPVLRCSGDEDLATQGARRAALARALKVRADLIVDLTELSFADASLMVDLATLALRLRQNGRRLLLRAPQPQIRRLIEMVGLHRQPGISFVTA
jgi:anti-anti-sigma factor